MHHPDNPASGRVLTKTGFTRTGTCERHADARRRWNRRGVPGVRVAVVVAVALSPASSRGCSHPPRTP
ncbi:hypothetical protein [Streptomyces caniferus]|uniref:hypothetical protein n=1 Tax=Streptomyces caniferus TaxID=285557 RepID=UPI00380CC538